MREAFLGIAMPVLLLAILVGAFMAYRALLPVRRLVETFRAVIETGDVEMRVPTFDARGEFAELSHLFNRMVERIERVVTGMRRSLDSVAHDLRTPMTRLQVRSELALREPDSESYREVLSQNIEDSTTVLTMLETMMEVAEAESGTIRLDRCTFDVKTMVDEVLDLYEFVAEDKGVAITDRIVDGLQLTGDRSRIRQVLANLVDNALKYTNPGGHVVVEAQAGSGEIMVSVEDDGIGIPLTDQHRIWDRLFRGDESRSKRGLGLGLSLVKAIAEAHGGRVSLRSDLQAGSRFTVHLPNGHDARITRM